MKRYRLNDPNTLLGILNKLQNIPVNQPGTELSYLIESPKIENGLAKSTHIKLTPLGGEIGKPELVVAILKENKVELKIKLLNPFQNDLFDVTEITIEPLARSTKRASLSGIQAQNIQIAENVQIATILSLYGKTSIITQTINKFQNHLERTLTAHNYFIKKINVGFFYSTTNPLLEQISQTKTPFFLRDSHKKIIYIERTFFNPKNKMQQREIDATFHNYLVNNIKSVLIVPLFTNKNMLIGYVEISSNTPNLGNPDLSENIESNNGISALLAFIESSSEDFIFNMEFAYVKEWQPISEKETIRDLSEDGRGVGIYYSGEDVSEKYPAGSKISFQISINNQVYTFFGNLKGWKKPKPDFSKGIIGTKIHSCDIPNGIELVQRYASNIIQGAL
ncbi:MAG: hypothetical protein GW938_12120 [Leptospira sp.]|jgi:hypothetical protein|nr:hypothetical protein [Leptospira sp.]NCS93041.1 hypothetical protein [Leptospira sp.]